MRHGIRGVWGGLLLGLLFCGPAAKNDTAPVVPLPEYSRDNPREWADIADEHIPQIKKITSGGREQLYVEVPLQKSDEGHYIEKIGLLTLDGKELAAVGLERKNRPQNWAYFSYEVITSQRKIKIYAKCNLHDLWVTEYRP